MRSRNDESKYDDEHLKGDPMTKSVSLKSIAMAAMLVGSTLSLGACGDDDPMEDAAKDAKEAGEKMKDAAEDAMN